MNNEQQELLDEAYENYVNKCNEDKWMKEIILDLPFSNKSYGLYSQEEFINKCKTDTEFSEKWGLNIEERELSLEERAKWLQDNKGYDLLVGNLDHDHIRVVIEKESPTKLITITYQGKKIESYE